VKSALAQYRRDVSSGSGRFSRYPRAAIEKKHEGRVEIRLAISSDGRLKDLTVENSSGYEELDAQALDMVRKGRVVEIPAVLRGHEFSVTISIIFSLQEPPS